MESESASEDSSEKNCDHCVKVNKDNDELRDVTQKLQSQLSVARAAQLAAHKTELPLLSQKLLDEKNLEIEQLKNHLSSLSSISMKQASTPGQRWTQDFCLVEHFTTMSSLNVFQLLVFPILAKKLDFKLEGS